MIEIYLKWAWKWFHISLFALNVKSMNVNFPCFSWFCVKYELISSQITKSTGIHNLELKWNMNFPWTWIHWHITSTHNIPQAQMLSYQFWKCVIITIKDVPRCTTMYIPYFMCNLWKSVREVCPQFQRGEVFCSPSRKSTSANSAWMPFPNFSFFHDLLHFFS